MKRAAAGLLVLLLSACSAPEPVTDAPASTTASVTTSAAASAAASAPAPSAVPPATPAGGAPLLQLTSNCYGACAYVDPLGLPVVTVYADGTVLRAEHDRSSNRLVLTTGAVDPSELGKLARLAREAELAGGGNSTLRFTHNGGYADGGGDVLTARLDGLTTTVESPQSYDAGLDRRSSDPAQRAALRRLSQALRALSATTPFEDSRVVLTAAHEAGQVGDVWTGPALAALPVTDPEDGRCAVLGGRDAARTLELVAGNSFAKRYAQAGAAWTVEARPAMPHEKTCAEVAETVRTAHGSSR